MANPINAFCKICGNGYHLCQSCREQAAFQPWRAGCDTAKHYKIYLAIHMYTITGDKERAKEALSSCDLSEIETFSSEIQTVLKCILSE